VLRFGFELEFKRAFCSDIRSARCSRPEWNVKIHGERKSSGSGL